MRTTVSDIISKVTKKSLKNLSKLDDDSAMRCKSEHSVLHPWKPSLQ